MAIDVKRYYSGMNASAPVLTGVAGSAVTLLDAILKDGFHSNTVTLAQTAGTATASCSSHGYNVNDVVVISGANESAWNNEFRVLTAATDSFTFAIDSGTTSPATGTITAKIAPLGWTKPFSGTNKGVYLAQEMYCQNRLRILDDSSTPTSASGRWAKARGYETMSDVDTGTGPFPTVAQSANALSWYKSSTSDSTVRHWWLVGDGGIFYHGTFWHASYLTLAGVFTFGDTGSLRSGDSYASLLTGVESDTLPSNPSTSNLFTSLGAYNATQAGKYLARASTQIGSAVAAGMMGDNGVSTVLGLGGLAYPHPVDNGLLFAPVAVVADSTIRSRGLPGLYQLLHTTPLAYLDPVTDLPDFPGRTFQAMDAASGGNRAQILFDITGPWR